MKTWFVLFILFNGVPYELRYESLEECKAAIGENVWFGNGRIIIDQPHRACDELKVATHTEGE